MDCTICVAKTKALISFAVTAKLICVFVFAYAKVRFSHDEAHILSVCDNAYKFQLLCTATLSWAHRNGLLKCFQNPVIIRCIIMM